MCESIFKRSADKWLRSCSNCACLPQQRLLQPLKCDENLSKHMQGTPALIIPTIKAKLVKTLLANYAMWPLAHIINFKFIPSKQRILYINCVQVKIAADSCSTVYTKSASVETCFLPVCRSSGVLICPTCHPKREQLLLELSLDSTGNREIAQHLETAIMWPPDAAFMSVIWFCFISEVVQVFGSCLLVI